MRRALPLLLLAACHREPEDTGGDAGCRAGSPRPDATRFALVSHPYDAASNQADAWEVLSFAPDGTLTRPGTAFEMGRGNGGPVRFTPDGSLAVAVQDDGSLGIVALDSTGTPRVIAARYADDAAGGAFYAVDAVFEPDGQRLWVVDGNFPENGGGIYAVDIDCTAGTAVTVDRRAQSKLGTHLLPRGDGRWVYVADEVLDSGPGDHVHLLDLSGPTRIDGATLWPDDEAIVGGAALGGDGTYVLVGDNSAFASVPNRVAVARFTATDIAPVQVVPDIEDPIAIATWGRSSLVASGFGNALVKLSYDAEASTPFASAGALSTTSTPQLPGAVAVAAGPDGDGWMLVAEVSAVRRVRATAAGALTDQGTLELGSGFDQIVGSVGLQP